MLYHWAQQLLRLLKIAHSECMPCRRHDGHVFPIGLQPAQAVRRGKTDAEWRLVADLFERPKGSRGAPARHERRYLVDACCYVLRTGCAWRLLPSSFAPWQAVYKAFVRWVEADAFEHMQDRLRQQWRARMSCGAEPNAAVIDAQANRASSQGGECGYDAGKKVKGRKRHIVWMRWDCCWRSR